MFNEYVDSFILLRPAWLFAIPLVLFWLWHLSKRAQSAGWNRYLPASTIDALRVSSSKAVYYRYFAVPVIIGSIALAGPSLTSSPTDVANSAHSRVVVLDLSPSMLARDLKPDRLTQARYKAIDLLRQNTEGEIALVVYAGTAYRVTPLTDDPATIEALVPTLHPDIMPAAGSNTEAAVKTAIDMLQASETTSGDVLLITDGVADSAIQHIKLSTPLQYQLSILGIGTTTGATIPLDSGVVTDELQQPVIASLNEPALRELANHFNGRYTSWTANSSDVEYLSVQADSAARVVVTQNQTGQVNTNSENQGATRQEFDRYRDLGYWLLPVLMVFAIYAFRKNVIYTLLPLFLISPMDAKSADVFNFWRNDNQQALAQLNRGNIAGAYQLFTRSDWKAVAAYRQQDYAEAARLLATPVFAEDLYNRGNAQAMDGELSAALKSFSQALLLYSENELEKRADTQHNIKVIKLLIDQNNTSDSEDGSNRASAATDNTRTRIDGESEAADQTEDDNSPANIGGATGRGQTLNQQSLAENSSGNTRQIPEQTQAIDLPDDASRRQPADITAQEQQLPNTESNTTETDTLAETESSAEYAENNNAVLSPYSEQFLRDLPQDPGGYLRRKFLYLYQTSEAEPGSQPVEVRY